MADILREENLLICVIYLDDITVVGHTPLECWMHTLHVLSRMTVAGMNLNARKLKFLLQIIDILGHRFGGGVYTP